MAEKKRPTPSRKSVVMKASPALRHMLDHVLPAVDEIAAEQVKLHGMTPKAARRKAVRIVKGKD